MNRPLFVLDTNVFISAHLIHHSTSAQAFDLILRTGFLALSEELLEEYREVLYRKKLDKYLSQTRREEIISKINRHAVFFTPIEKINACRDVKDNLILELAVSCDAKCIVSGDSDLLVLNPFRFIPIITGQEFLSGHKH